MSEVKTSRSQLVRDYVNSVPPKQRAPLAVVAALKERGITISASLVSYVKHNLKKKRKAGVSSKTVSKKKNIEIDFDVKSCLIAKNLLASVDGDLQAAKKNLEIVSKLLS